MRALIVLAALLVGSASPATASPPNWPIAPTVRFSVPEPSGAGGGTATVQVKITDDAHAIEVEVYGLDGMRVGKTNKAHVHRDQLKAGGSITLHVRIYPGAGQSLLTVSAYAQFERAGYGGVVRTFPFGKENAAQQAEHSRCVRQDPEGVWIRDPDCVEPTAPAEAPPPPGAPPAPSQLSIGDLQNSPPVGRAAQIVGFVVGSYLCPPCPPGAQCKPCASESVLFIADTSSRDPVAPGAHSDGVVAIGVKNPASFERGARYRFEIEVVGRRGQSIDGRLLRSQRLDQGAAGWKNEPVPTASKP